MSWFSNWFTSRKRFIGKLCGHPYGKKTTVVVFGQEWAMVSNKNEDYCPECSAKKAIQCPLCDGAIMPGELILLAPPVKDISLPNRSMTHEGLWVVCMAHAEMGSADATGRLNLDGQLYIPSDPKDWMEMVSTKH